MAIKRYAGKQGLRFARKKTQGNTTRTAPVQRASRSTSRKAATSNSHISENFKRAAAGLGHRHGPGRRLKFRWTQAMSAEDWEQYCRAIKALREANVPFMLGGGFALATFTGRWRDTKDIDFYIHPGDREAAVTALTKAGFADYYSQRAYDRKWIYRSTRSGVIVDVIWAMANQRAQVDDLWFHHARSMLIRGEKLQVLPLEEFMWCKLYIMQRDHCDWTDIFNLPYAVGPRLDWARLLKRLEEDLPVLRALLGMFSW